MFFNCFKFLNCFKFKNFISTKFKGMRKNIYNQISSFIEFIKSSEGGVSLFTKNQKYVKFKNLEAGENIKLDNTEDTIRINAISASSRSNNSYVKVLLSGIVIKDSFTDTLLEISSEYELSIRIIGYSYEGHSTHYFVNNDVITSVGISNKEDEFYVIGTNQNCRIIFDRQNQLFTYTVEILSKTPVTVNSNYWLRYIS